MTNIHESVLKSDIKQLKSEPNFAMRMKQTIQDTAHSIVKKSREPIPEANKNPIVVKNLSASSPKFLIKQSSQSRSRIISPIHHKIRLFEDDENQDPDLLAKFIKDYEDKYIAAHREQTDRSLSPPNNSIKKFHQTQRSKNQLS